MGKNTLSLKDLNETGGVTIVEMERTPKYVIKPPKFSCPISPNVLWHHNMEYKECPVSEMQRDMSECIKCKLRGDGKAKMKNKQTHKKASVKIDKSNKEPIPNIGKTYTSD